MGKINKNSSYALITPARNEAAYIGATIQALIAQTVLPLKWVIVSDGSTDSTDAIVKKYSAEHSWIELIRMPEHRDRQFAAKVYCFNAGYEALKEVDYAFIGNLDADVTFEPDYFEKLIKEFHGNQKLGIGGGIIQELIKSKYVAQNISLNSVAGAVQLFRRECYEATGGYIPIKHGGIDAASEIMARMHGWEVRTFPDIKVHHHRRVSTGAKNILLTKFKGGITNYLLGYHPLFHFLSCVPRIAERPYLLGSMFSALGYCWAFLNKHEKIMAAKTIRFLRDEQMARIRSTVLRKGQ